MFQRRHYIQTAEILAETHNVRPATVERFVYKFRRDNANFDPARFIAHFRNHYEFVWGHAFIFEIETNEYTYLMR